MFLRVVQTSHHKYWCVRGYTPFNMTEEYIKILQDKEIAKFLDIDLQEMQKKFIEEFCGFENKENPGNIYFIFGTDAEKAKDWLEPYLIAKLLVGDNNV